MNANGIQYECVHMLQAYKRCQETSCGSLCVPVLLLQCRDGITQKGLTMCFMTSMGIEVTISGHRGMKEAGESKLLKYLDNGPHSYQASVVHFP